MAQVSIINRSDIKKAQRFDAEYFKPEFLEIEKEISKHNYCTLGGISSLFVKGIFDINASVTDDVNGLLQFANFKFYCFDKINPFLLFCDVNIILLI